MCDCVDSQVSNDSAYLGGQKTSYPARKSSERSGFWQRSSEDVTSSTDARGSDISMSGRPSSSNDTSNSPYSILPQRLSSNWQSVGQWQAWGIFLNLQLHSLAALAVEQFANPPCLLSGPDWGLNGLCCAQVPRMWDKASIPPWKVLWRASSAWLTCHLPLMMLVSAARAPQVSQKIGHLRSHFF